MCRIIEKRKRTLERTKKKRGRRFEREGEEKRSDKQKARTREKKQVPVAVFFFAHYFFLCSLSLSFSSFSFSDLPFFFFFYRFSRRHDGRAPAGLDVVVFEDRVIAEEQQIEEELSQRATAQVCFFFSLSLCRSAKKNQSTCNVSLLVLTRTLSLCVFVFP